MKQRNAVPILCSANLLLLLSCLFFAATDGVAQSFRSEQRTAGFECPLKLRPRVNFWIDVFTKYGKNDVVLHHRNFPQAVYGVLDLAVEADVLSPNKFAAYKKKAINTEIAEIRMAIKSISQGKSPRTRLEYRVRDALLKVPASTSKYKTALDKDMIRAQTGIKEKYAEAIKRSGRYMHILVRTFVQDFGLPIELTRLPFIESSFDYKAYSSVGAAGIWQFMPRTARGFGMKVGSVIDERRDVPVATRGAAKYLTVAYKELNDWPLALTSYNHGVAGVKRKVKKFGSSDIIELIENPSKQAFGFASGNFWPEFLAALDVYDNYKQHFPGLVIESPRHFTSFRLPHSMSVGYVSKKVGIPESLLQDYNYALSPSVWKGRYKIPAGYELRVPKNLASSTIALRAPEPQAQTSSIYGGVKYRVRRGDTLNKIAKKFGVSSARIKALNNMRSTTVYVGQVLTVKESEARSVSTSTASVANASGSYRVRSGDSLYGIAKRFRMSVSDLMHINDLRDATIQPGQVLKVAGTRAISIPTNVATYRVRSGDTVSTIAGRHGMSSKTLMALNGLRSSRITVGQRLKVKGSTSASSPKYHKVGRGDTLWDIARKYGKTITAIKEANGLRKNSLYVGQKLKIP